MYICVGCAALLSELWWLQGHYHDRNQVTDTQERCLHITKQLRRGVQNGSIVASYTRQVGGVDVLFVHAGFRRDMITHMKKEYSIEGTAEELSAVTNEALLSVVSSQSEV